ncbi:hypothetical protein BC829DRAFT_29771 [Chytridium lagenaria]|nr:hypothetical protein BC829DRAFT_29771 [Chytridium lagenaria]
MFTRSSGEEGTSEKLPKLFAALPLQAAGLKDAQSLSNLVGKGPARPTVSRAIIPARGETLPGMDIEIKESEEDSIRKAELQRGQAYLKRFKSLSRAFATGEFRIIPTGLYETPTEVPALWQKSSLYGKLDDANLAIARLYKEERGDLERPAVYKPETGVMPDANVRGTGAGIALSQVVDREAVKIYESKGNAHPALPTKPQTS